jgi:hypothetical protein
MSIINSHQQPGSEQNKTLRVTLLIGHHALQLLCVSLNKFVKCWFKREEDTAMRNLFRRCIARVLGVDESL